MKLYLLRHATAVDVASSDAARELTKEGREEAQRAAERAYKPGETLAQLHRVAVDTIKSSPLRDKEGNTLERYFIHGLGHWLGMGARLKAPPRIFRVNWFRRDGAGRFLWPGYGENVRVLKWIVDRIHGKADARETPIGYVPAAGALELNGSNIAPESGVRISSGPPSADATTGTPNTIASRSTSPKASGDVEACTRRSAAPSKS